MALASLDRQLSWSELEQASSGLAGAYLGLGLSPGDRIASLMPNRVELVVHYLACLRAGLVATPLNDRYAARQIDHALEVSGASLLLAHVERSEDLRASRQAAKLSLGVLCFGDSGAEAASFRELSTSKTDPVDAPSLDGSAATGIFFTSGSTGPAKGVTHSRDQRPPQFAGHAQELYGSSWRNEILQAISVPRTGTHKKTLLSPAGFQCRCYAD